MLAKPSFFIRFASRAFYKVASRRRSTTPPLASNELLIARGTPPNPGGEFLLQAPHKWPISRPLLHKEGNTLGEFIHALYELVLPACVKTIPRRVHIGSGINTSATRVQARLYCIPSDIGPCKLHSAGSDANTMVSKPR